MPWPDLNTTMATINSIKDFTDRFPTKTVLHHMNPSEVELDSMIAQVKTIVKTRKVAVFVFIIGYFKAPCNLLLPFLNHNTGHYVSYDLDKLKELPNCFYKVVIE